MTTLRRPFLLLVTTLAVTVAPASALAAQNPILRECQNGKITGSYSQAQYADALRNIPTDLDEYSDCRNIVRRAQLGAAGGSSAGSGSGSGGAGGSGGGGDAVVPEGGGTGPTSSEQLLASASPAEQKAVTDANGGGADPVEVGGRLISPRSAGLSPAGAANVVPTPLIVALVLLALGLILAAAQHVRTRLVPGTEGLRARVRARRHPSA